MRRLRELERRVGRRAATLGVVLLTFAGSAPEALRAQLRYDREYPAIPYARGTTSDPVARLGARIAEGRAALEFEPSTGYLRSLLSALEIPLSSQTLVFSATSLQAGLISAETPRAIYFDDETYVAWAQGTEALEIAALDPDLGAVFYLLYQDPVGGARFPRQTFSCLECHDSFGLTGGGVPRFIMGSGLADARGQIAVHGGWELTTPSTPLERRWGGWYVTGTHGRQLHLGNAVIRDPSAVASLDLRATGNLTDLSALFDTDPYPSAHSDIVALLVLEHQVHLQNILIRASWEVRSLEAGDPSGERVVAERAEELLRAILFVGEAPLSGPIEGTSGFAADFEARGPWDSRGRSLRQLDLTTRLFRYPLSYQVYTEAFDALPPRLRNRLVARLSEVLSGRDRDTAFDHISEAERTAITEILRETKPSLATALSGRQSDPAR